MSEKAETVTTQAGTASLPPGPAAQRTPRHRRPTGAPPPLPHPVSVTTRAWLVLAVVVLAGVIVISVRAPASFDRARTELLYGESLRRRRKRLQAREHLLRAALELFERLSADPWAERARTELRACGETPRRRDPGRAQQLTPQEHQVARIVAAGATSEEAAARLFLSREPSTRTFAASTPSSASPPVVNCKPPILTTSDPIPARG